MSQPDPKFYINEHRKSPGADGTTLQPPQKQQYEPTRWELDQARWYAKEDPRHQWVLVQLRKMRTTLAPRRTIQGNDDYSYTIASPDFQQKMREIDDWYRMTNEDADTPNIEISSYSWEQAVAASDEWHAVAAGEGAGKIYESTNPDLVIFNPPEWEGWSIQKVVSRNDLQTEGNRMNHCVGRYCNDVAVGATEIYSLRDNKNEPHVTLEMNRAEEDTPFDQVIQIMGNSDTEPDEAYKVYIKQWFAELQKTRPKLSLANEEAFDFDNLRNVENSEIDEEIGRIVHKGNEYGLKAPLNLLDIENVYDAVMHELSSSNYRSSDTRFVAHIGPAIANAAWDADKYRASELMIQGDVEFSLATPEQRLNMFKTQSKRMGVDWLWDKIQKNNESFYDNFSDYFESQLSLDNFENEAEYENAQMEEQDEYERYARSDALPYALDDEIASTLVQLAKIDPFLPEHTPKQEVVQQPVVASWLARIAQQELPHTSIDASGRRFETGVPVEFRYIRNNQPAPGIGSKYQQDIEPAGRYLIHNEEPGPEDYLKELERRGWEFGTHRFESPLVMAFNVNNEAYYDENSWKAVLSRKFGGFKGEALTRAIVGQGYDGIVTVRLNERGEPLYVSEIVDLTGFQKQGQKAMPLPKLEEPIPRYERGEHSGVSRIDDLMNYDTADALNNQYPQIEYGGAGAIGIAYQTGPNEILKITRDWREVDIAQKFFREPVDWIVPILAEPRMIQDHPPLWGIQMKKLTPIKDVELALWLDYLTKQARKDTFPDHAQASFIVESDLDEEKWGEAMALYSGFDYILDQRSMWLPDIHGGNVGWDNDDGKLKIFDLGPGLTS